jgi:hypothetical protein
MCQTSPLHAIWRPPRWAVRRSTCPGSTPVRTTTFSRPRSKIGRRSSCVVLPRNTAGRLWLGRLNSHIFYGHGAFRTRDHCGGADPSVPTSRPETDLGDVIRGLSDSSLEVIAARVEYAQRITCRGQAGVGHPRPIGRTAANSISPRARARYAVYTRQPVFFT